VPQAQYRRTEPQEYLPTRQKVVSVVDTALKPGVALSACFRNSARRLNILDRSSTLIPLFKPKMETVNSSPLSL
jgi:hypothetical protein